MSTLDFLQGTLEQERSLFGSVVKAVPDSGLDHRPDPKSRSSRQLVAHILGHFYDLAELAEEGVIHHRNEMPFDDIADAVRQLDEGFALALAKLAATDPSRWLEPARFQVGEHLVMEAPREQLAWVLLLDAIHHRGQLTTHLRATGSKVPSIYGPSADEPPAGH